MLKKKLDHPALLAFFVFLISLAIFIAAIPEGYEYNSEVRLSPHGMRWATGFLEIPEEVSQGEMGYIGNGQFFTYTNWPATGFKIQALWMKYLGTTLYHARLLMVLISTLTVLLFYWLVKHFTSGSFLPFVVAIAFSVLPYHLTFSSLVYADIWVLLFWAAFLLAVVKGKNIYILAVISLSGLFFMWMIPLMLPAYFIVLLIDQKKITPIQQIVYSCLLFLSINICIYLFSSFSDHTMANKLYTYSLLGMIETPGIRPYLFFRRFIVLALEFSPFIFLLAINWKGFKVQDIPKGLRHVILVAGWTMVFYLMIFSNWYGIHTHGIVMFDLLIGLCILAVLLQVARKKRLGQILLVTALSVIGYMAIPIFSRHTYEVEKRDEQIVTFINQSDTSPKKKCLFFDTKNVHMNTTCERIAISTLCNAYSFSAEDTYFPLPQNFETGIERLKNLPLNVEVDFETLYFITDKPNHKTPYFISDSLRLGEIGVYKLIRKNGLPK